MDLNDISRILIKIAGICIVMFVVLAAPSYISYYYSLQLKEESITTFFFISMVPMIIPVVTGLLMWRFPGTISNKVVSGDKKIEEGDSKTIEDIERIAYSVLGIYLLFKSLSDISYHITYYAMIFEVVGSGALEMDRFSFIIATIVEILLALILIFGSKTIVQFLRKFRHSGTK